MARRRRCCCGLVEFVLAVAVALVLWVLEYHRERSPRPERKDELPAQGQQADGHHSEDFVVPMRPEDTLHQSLPR
jgi:hypothetical protein